MPRKELSHKDLFPLIFLMFFLVFLVIIKPCMSSIFLFPFVCLERKQSIKVSRNVNTAIKARDATRTSGSGCSNRIEFSPSLSLGWQGFPATSARDCASTVGSLDHFIPCSQSRKTSNWTQELHLLLTEVLSGVSTCAFGVGITS